MITTSREGHTQKSHNILSTQSITDLFGLGLGTFLGSEHVGDLSQPPILCPRS